MIEQLKELLFIQNLVIAIVVILFQLIIRAKPSVPPSAVAESEDDRDLAQSFRVMKENSNFMLLSIAFALTFGSYVGFGNIMSNIIDPYGLTPQDIAQIGLVLLITGVIGAVSIGIWVDRTGMYKCTSVVMLAMITVVVVIMVLALHS